MAGCGKKIKISKLLPTINVKANLLNKGYDMFNGIGKTGFYENNNKFGIDIGLPLRLSEGRGSYKLAKLKIAGNQSGIVYCSSRK